MNKSPTPVMQEDLRKNIPQGIMIFCTEYFEGFFQLDTYGVGAGLLDQAEGARRANMTREEPACGMNVA